MAHGPATLSPEAEREKARLEREAREARERAARSLRQRKAVLRQAGEEARQEAHAAFRPVPAAWLCQDCSDWTLPVPSTVVSGTTTVPSTSVSGTGTRERPQPGYGLAALVAATARTPAVRVTLEKESRESLGMTWEGPERLRLAGIVDGSAADRAGLQECIGWMLVSASADGAVRRVRSVGQLRELAAGETMVSVALHPQRAVPSDYFLSLLAACRQPTFVCSTLGCHGLREWRCECCGLGLHNGKCRNIACEDFTPVFPVPEHKYRCGSAGRRFD